MMKKKFALIWALVFALVLVAPVATTYAAEPTPMALLSEFFCKGASRD